jgi:hypothetical protein
MQDHTDPTPESALKPKATAVKKSTPRTKNFRDKKASAGLQRLDIYTSEEIKSQVREVAKKEGKTAGIAAESLLALGIEAYLQGCITPDTGISVVQSEPTAQSDGGTNPAIRAISPRHRLQLHIKPADIQQSRTNDSGPDISPTTSTSSNDINRVETMSNAAVNTQTMVKASGTSIEIPPNGKSGGMDRQRHRIKPFDPTKPSGKLHSEILEFMGQDGYFHVGVFPLSSGTYELIFFQPKDGSKKILITDISGDTDLLNFLKEMQTKEESTQALDTKSQAI